MTKKAADQKVLALAFCQVVDHHRLRLCDWFLLDLDCPCCRSPSEVEVLAFCLSAVEVLACCRSVVEVLAFCLMVDHHYLLILTAHAVLICHLVLEEVHPEVVLMEVAQAAHHWVCRRP